MTLSAHDVLAFDVYGTLVDTGGVVERLRDAVGDRAEAFSDAWRQDQLGYTWRRALMHDYVDFGTCTAQALDHTATTFATPLSEEDRDDLLEVYRRLPAFPDTAPALERLAAGGLRLVAFTNGPAAAAEELLDVAGVRRHLHDVVSADEIRSFKPDPAVYHHLLERVATMAGRVVVVSSNSFDVIGAKHAGLQAAWVRRTAAASLDPWGVEPDAVIGELSELA